MNYSFYACTDIGKVRSNNEDNFYLNGDIRQDISIQHMETGDSLSGDTFLFAVCDGMGGEDDGEWASLAAVFSLRSMPELSRSQEAERNASLANQAVCKIHRERPGSSAGSTLAAVSIQNEEALFFNVGDSRGYLFRDGALQQMTTDHTMAQKMADLGIFSEKEAAVSPYRNSLTYFLGVETKNTPIEPALSPAFRIRSGDKLLLCSDGLYDMVPNTMMEDIMLRSTDCRGAVLRLTKQALDAGGLDNVTVIVIAAE